MINSARQAAGVALCLAVPLLASPWARPARADTAQVTVVFPGGRSQTLSLAAMAGSEDVVGRSYALRSSAGESSRTVTGFSIVALLGAAYADPFSFSYLEVQRPVGGSILLSSYQALDDGAFPDGPPVVYPTPTGTGFLRPSAGSEDANVVDNFEAPQGVSIVLRKGSLLRVRARASTTRTRPGEPVSFRAMVGRVNPGEQLAFSWYFDDGHRAGDEVVRHSFAKRGSYDVVLGVTSESDDVGASAVVTIQVGAPIEGPDRKGGGTNRDTDAPDHGAAGGSGGEGWAGSAAGPVAEATPTVRGGGAASAPRGTPASAPPTTEPAGARQTEVRAPAGELVSGEVLSASTERQLPSQPPAAARRGRLEEGEGSGGLSTAAWGGLATLGLLGLGALGEAGGLLALRRRGATHGPLGDGRQTGGAA